MKVVNIAGTDYRLPNALNAFQRDMYVHLINWKWQNITTDPVTYRGAVYDALLPPSPLAGHPLLHPSVRPALQRHYEIYPFRIHKFFNHMASSQAANINLFLPVLADTNADRILAAVNPDVATIARTELDNGYRIEFWDEGFGVLRDKSKVAGTDSDIAIAYYNHQGELCLWLIEHKLTEKEFTPCGGYRSPNKQNQHDCGKTFSQILKNKEYCCYHDACRFNYWDITDTNQTFFLNHGSHKHCPFKGGMNQLWRNQLMALGVEQDSRQPYKHVSFSVVKHPRNAHLDATLNAYKNLIANNPKFSVFTSSDVLAAGAKHGSKALGGWISWYKGLYNV